MINRADSGAFILFIINGLGTLGMIKILKLIIKIYNKCKMQQKTEYHP